MLLEVAEVIRGISQQSLKDKKSFSTLSNKIEELLNR